MLRSSAAAYRRMANAAVSSSTCSSSTMGVCTKSMSSRAGGSLSLRAQDVVAFRSSNTALRAFSTGGNSYSSFAEPGSLFGDQLQDPPVFVESLSAPTMGGDKDAQLRADVRAMGSLLGHIIQDHHGKEIFEKIEELRALAKNWREAGAGRQPETAAQADEYFQNLSSACGKLSNDEMLIISRAFAHFLAIANSAEAHHRARLLKKATTFEALPERYDSCGGVMKSLLEEGHSADAIFEALSTQQTELVLTAHPTEVNRRTILEKQRRVQTILTQADDLRDKNQPPTGFAQRELDRAMEREIASIWQSDEVSRAKPTPQNEAARGTLVVETVLWEALPNFLRKLNAMTQSVLGKSLPLDATPIKFSSWMGGDRDGNPNVTPEVTREVLLKQRAQAAGLFLRDLSRLHSELSIMNCSEELRAVVGDEKEPYRAFLAQMMAKMKLTKDWAEERLNNPVLTSRIEATDVYTDRQDFKDDLMLIHRSLCETENTIEADGFLTDVIRNVSAFGLTMVTLDVRQESNRHEEAMDTITRFLGLGSYSQWDEETRLKWLEQQLVSPRPLLRPGIWNEHPEVFSPTCVDTLETFAMIAEQHEGSLGAYVISQCTSASDIFSVLVLQKDAGVKKPLRVAPLFETLDDLNGAADTMKKLFSMPSYMGAINGKHEIMIGYSDSAKDAGRLAASWAQYETQEKLAAIGREAGVELTFFHGKGGTVGRGGNPQTFLAIMAHAPDTINGRFRVTEQGEMINQNFGYYDRAQRTMDIYTAAVLAEKLTEHVRPTDEWRNMMKTLSDISCEAYRRVIRGDERFVPYFRSATPELEFANLNIGSRPAKRNPKGGVESLRAIPWNFSWTQTRLNLPTWLGVGEAFEKVLSSNDGPVLREMYQQWPSFRTTVDMVEMVLAKSEPKVAAHYDKMLVTDELAKELGVELRELHLKTEDAVLDLSGHDILSENNKILLRLLQVRNPYVDVLNCLQAEALKRFRGAEDKEDKVLKDLLLTTITGVANGMGNTG
ncbi:phosphoenolpyruvate carboxylase [Nitzschia inconspicua]|uniref:Phosphoenolpyruvate carboxylase n=1 Tax=Nitzschia inconspicua TaxID=303405 RepID=A0A9K3Q3P2_9STRA|nr:phosphoenolpyruvate carboxylase [Nitzschia inconspicua]